MSASFCWECGKKLQRVNGELAFREVTPPGGVPVRIHIECAKNFGKDHPSAQMGVKRAVRKYIGTPEPTDED
jgi:hypothetical protein